MDRYQPLLWGPLVEGDLGLYLPEESVSENRLKHWLCNDL